MPQVVFSKTGEIHGAGSYAHKWVSHLSSDEQLAVKEDRLVVILGAPTHGGYPSYRKVIYAHGRYHQRVPTKNEQFLIDGLIK